MKVLVVLLAAVLLLDSAVDGTLSDISTGDVTEMPTGSVPADQECGFKQFQREFLTPLRNYGPNVCRRRAVYLESRQECNFRRVCRRIGMRFNCWYECMGNKRCVTSETTYTFQPTCCEGFASAIDAGVVNRSVDTNQLLRTEGCPIVNMVTLRATCVLQGDVHGNITIMQATPEHDAVITGVIEGLTPGLHGFHIHEFGSFLGGCSAAGRHYNPFGQTHGGPDDDIRHVGDLGNIEADGNGVARINITDRMVKLHGPISVNGRSFVVHANEDDLGLGGFSDSLTTGHAGGRVGCCTIGIARGA